MSYDQSILNNNRISTNMWPGANRGKDVYAGGMYDAPVFCFGNIFFFNYINITYLLKV